MMDYQAAKTVSGRAGLGIGKGSPGTSLHFHKYVHSYYSYYSILYIQVASPPNSTIFPKFAFLEH